MTTRTAPVDLQSDYWVVKQCPDLVVEADGVRVNVDQLMRVQRARRAMEQVLPSGERE